MQPVVERCPDRDDTPARTRAGFQHDDRHACLAKKIRGAQAGEARAHDDNWRIGLPRMRGDAANGGKGERNRTGRLLKKSSAIHGLLPLVCREAASSRTGAGASSQGHRGPSRSTGRTARRDDTQFVT